MRLEVSRIADLWCDNDQCARLVCVSPLRRPQPGHAAPRDVVLPPHLQHHSLQQRTSSAHVKPHGPSKCMACRRTEALAVWSAYALADLRLTKHLTNTRGSKLKRDMKGELIWIRRERKAQIESRVWTQS